MGSTQDSIKVPDEFKSFIGAFLKEQGPDPWAFEMQAVPADGSRRSFWRVTHRRSDISFIAMANQPQDEQTKRENVAYLMIGRHLHEKHLPIPQIHVSDLNKGWFILQDFGKENLQQVAASCADRVPLYEQVAAVLFQLQIEGAEGFQPCWTCQTEKYDHTVMRRHEADYFRDAFLCRYLGLKREWPELEHSLNHIAGNASCVEDGFFLHRDFQSRNLMVHGGAIGILDWQGGRLGPLGYDLASLLFDPYVSLTMRERERVCERYTGLLSDRFPQSVTAFRKSFPYLALQRHLQILGAFSFLSRVRKRAHFEAYIFPALVSLRSLLGAVKEEGLSPLTDLVEAIHDSMAKAQRKELKAPNSQQ